MGHALALLQTRIAPDITVCPRPYPHLVSLHCKASAQDNAQSAVNTSSTLSDVIGRLPVQRMAESLGFFVAASLATAGLPCTTTLLSLTAIAGETLKDQVTPQCRGSVVRQST